MQAINAKHMGIVRNVPRMTFLGLALLLACPFGCAPAPSQGNGTQGSSASAPTDIPEITDELIHEWINNTGIRNVPEENGSAEPTNWNFDEDEPKEITVVEKQIEATRATIVLDIKTTSAPRARDPRYLAGQIRTEWELRTGWVLRKWEIVNAENISMKYRNLPKPPAQNSNR
ncbi:MAG: hypothetical protein WKF92_09060 [Pyrinomonadaceae bacterium]